MRTRSALPGLGCVILVLAASGCKKKADQSPSPSDFGGFKANVSMQPRNASPTQDQLQPPAPVLTATSATIGRTGGALASSDGKLRVSIPAGAFASETEVRIQPKIDDLGESFGLVYELSPEGVTFSQPVTLAWNISDADLQRTNMDNLVVRSREANQHWKIQSNVERNGADHTIRVQAKHFSQWDLAMTLRIQPSFAKVFVGDSLELTAYAGTTDRSPDAPDNGSTSTTSGKGGTGASQSQSTSDDDLLAAPEDHRHKIFWNAEWKVNGEHCGTHKTGYVKQNVIGHFNVDSAAFQPVSYITPDDLPSPNPVTVSFEIKIKDPVAGGKEPAAYTERKMIATAQITVLPREDHWVGYSDIKQNGSDKVSSQFTFAQAPKDQKGPVRTYEVFNGTVGYKGPKTVSGGTCTLFIWPSSQVLKSGPARPAVLVSDTVGTLGMLRVDMSDPNRWLISGQGESQWLADYTTYCPNGAGTIQTGVHAGWWPLDPLNMGAATPVTITSGIPPEVYVKIDGPMATGTVHLTYMGSKPDDLLKRMGEDYYCQ